MKDFLSCIIKCNEIHKCIIAVLPFDVFNVFCVFFSVYLCAFFVSLFMLLYRTVHTCQVQSVILRQGMSDITLV